jgi:uncharacterized protein
MTDNDRAWMAYSAPLLVFGVLTTAEGAVPVAYYPEMYAVKIALVVATLLAWRAPLRDIQPSWSVVLSSIALGIAIWAMWVGIEEHVPYPHLGSRVGFDPTTITEPRRQLLFLVVRLTGLIVVVPVMEELFWRSFLLRFATHHDFRSLPIGQFSLGAFALMVGVSGAAHTEWLVGALASVLFGWWLRRTRSLFATIVAHSVANAALGIDLLTRHQWQYW